MEGKFQNFIIFLASLSVTATALEQTWTGPSCSTALDPRAVPMASSSASEEAAGGLAAPGGAARAAGERRGRSDYSDVSERFGRGENCGHA